MSKITTTLPNITANSSISSLSIANGTTAFTYANTGYDQGGIPVESMMPKQALSSEQMKYAIENVKVLVTRLTVNLHNMLILYLVIVSIIFQTFLG